MKKSTKAAKETTEIVNDSGRQEALESTIAGIVKQFGKGSIMKLGDKALTSDVPVIPTGALSLDIALGIGGVPKGRIIEIFGPESSGKTTIALHIVAEAQRQGGICGYVDAEHAMDPIYARNVGVNIDELYISQPDDGEQALEITEAMVRSGALDVVIVDSVAALTPRAEIEGNMGDSHVGLQARLMSQALRKLTAFALELLPRTTRAQAMDVLSSQAAVAGYRAMLIAAEEDSPESFAPIVDYYNLLMKNLGWEDKGMVLAGGVYKVGDIAGKPSLGEAKKLGASM